MAFVKVRSSAIQTGSSVTSIVLTMVGTTVNNLIVVHARSNVAITSIVDNNGNSYTFAQNISGGNRAFQAYAVQIVGGTTTITITIGSSCFIDAFTEEWSGVERTNTLAYNNSSQSLTLSATTLSVPSFSMPSGSLIIATAICGGFATWTGDTDYVVTTGNTRVTSQYKLNSSTSEISSISISGETNTIAEISTAFNPYIPLAQLVNIQSINRIQSITI